MNAKKAKQLRKTAKLAGAPVDTVYKDSADSVWGPLPTRQTEDGKAIPGTVDKFKLNKALQKISAPKFKNITLKTGFNSTRIEKELRYVPGIPTQLGVCERMIYKHLKIADVG